MGCVGAEGSCSLQEVVESRCGGDECGRRVVEFRDTTWGRGEGEVALAESDGLISQVLHRPGESSGVAFWTGQLNAHKKTRGQVMVGFSESNEYKVKTAEQVDVVDVFTGMLRRVPTGAENTLWVAALKDTSERTDLIASLLASAAYDTRIPA